jgi:hypothetical protein
MSKLDPALEQIARERPHLVGAPGVTALVAELDRLRAIEQRAEDVQGWHEDEASTCAAWRAATYIRNGAAPGVDPRRAVVDGR